MTSSFMDNVAHAKLSNTQEKIAEFILQHKEKIPFYSINDIAEQLNVSTASVTRFVHAVGYDTFKDLKSHILAESDSTPSVKLENRPLKDGQTPYAHFVNEEIEHIRDTFRHLNESKFTQILNTIEEVNNIYIYAKGAAYSMAELLAFRLKRFGKKVVCIKASGSEIFEDAHQMTKDDLCILFGFGSMPIEIKTLIDITKKLNICSLLFSDSLVLPPSATCDFTIYINRGYANVYHSMTTTALVIDTIIVMLYKNNPKEKTTILNGLHELKESYKDRIPRA